MTLRSRGSRKPIVVGDFKFGGNTDIPLRTVGPYTEKDIRFINAVADSSNELIINNSITSQISGNISVSNHPSISNGIIAPLYIGNPGSPTPEFIYANPYIFDNSDFYPEYSDSCSKTFLFANLVAKRRDDGFLASDLMDDKIPYSPSISKFQNDVEKQYQVIFTNQNIYNDSLISIYGLNMIMRSNGRGISVIHGEKLDIDTWYNGKFNNYNIGNNVGIGYTNDTSINWNVGDRYNWSFGTIFFTYNLSTKIDRNIDGTIKNCSVRSYSIDGNDLSPLADFPEDVKNGKQIKAEYDKDIKLVAWKFIVDNVLDINDIYNRDNSVSWDNNIIKTGDTKDSIHLPDSYTGYISGYYDTFTETDNPMFKDIGIYSKTYTNWFKKINGKALYKHTLKNIISSDDYILLNIDSDGDLVISIDKDCFTRCLAPSSSSSSSSV